ncbi:MAG TPA: heavy metal translocating P-type ATPase, partial [Candidatus Limnocylindria bacterium]|nr:heavy metal translocating P-type ATPase [Candidatus Limnocylindria bacterium]
MGDSGHHEAMIADFRRRFWIVLVLSVPIVVLSEMAQMLFGYMVMFPGSNLLLFALSSIVFFYGGWPFFTGARSEMRAGRPEMMMLIT